MSHQAHAGTGLVETHESRMSMMVLAHGGHLAVYLFPVGAIVFLIWLLKKEAPKQPKAASTTPTVLPRSPLSRQVFTATRPKTRLRTTPPKNGGFRPPVEVTPLRPPPSRQDRRGA
jgi:hypothetical protein